jgi:NAD(P)-dependent dehydrogenase (short-subunit alcohol dehydrogenase family)
VTAAALPPHASVAVQLPAVRRSGLLAGSVAVVTGGGRGVGRAIACALADAGAAVVVSGRHPEFLEQTAATVADRGGSAAMQVCDVSDAAQARDLVRQSSRHFGVPDVLVNNAGEAVREPADDGLAPEEFDRLFATNVRGLYYACLGAARCFTGGGAIVNISSVTARVPDGELAAYAAGKAAVDSLTRTLAVSFGPLGIRVNAVAPGYLDSPLNRARKADPDRAAAVVGRTPLGRWGLPADVADAVCFLASSRSAFVSGQILAVDGGFPTAPPLRAAAGGRKDTGDCS